MNDKNKKLFQASFTQTGNNKNTRDKQRHVSHSRNILARVKEVLTCIWASRIFFLFCLCPCGDEYSFRAKACACL